MIGTKGLFCANFGHERGTRGPCTSAWHGKCYESHQYDRFHINKPEDESGFLQVDKQDELRFKQARDGDHLMCSFQCDTCIFYMMKGRYPIERNNKDILLEICIRRANLDAMWSREPSTVAGNRRETEKMIKTGSDLGIEPSFEALGPFPLNDVQGFKVAVCMLKRSLEPGRYAIYSQFETIRKFRSTYSNIYMASIQGCMEASSIGRSTPKSFLSHCPTNSLWFEKFSLGCLKRMGQIIKQDLGISIEVELALLEQIKQDIKDLALEVKERKKRPLEILRISKLVKSLVRDLVRMIMTLMMIVTVKP